MPERLEWGSLLGGSRRQRVANQYLPARYSGKFIFRKNAL